MQDSNGARTGDTPILPAAMLFDMDGTLTVPYFDFDAIRREVGVGNQPILEAVEKMDEANDRRPWKYSIATRMSVPPGAC